MFFDESLETDMTIWSVSDFSQHIQKNLQQHVPLAWVIGELSGLYRAQSGHIYATLKDAQSQIKIVIYASVAQRLVFKLEEGLKVRLLGQATLYKPRGELQLVAKNLEPDGLGPLKLAFEQIKAKLQAEGLFALEHKKKLPLYPKSIALITSADGAVYHDMMRVLMRRYPIVRVTLYPCAVQGTRAIPEILQSLQDCLSDGGSDLIIIARGGGSLEDLWAFNSEEVVRAVFAFPLPIISAIGHETDVTLCDFAADLRAATPSVAAELAVPDLEIISKKLQMFEQNWLAKFQQIFGQYQQRLDYQERFLKQSSFLFEQLQTQVRTAQERLQSCIMRRLEKEELNLKHRLKFFSYIQKQLQDKTQQYYRQCNTFFNQTSLAIQNIHNKELQNFEHLAFRLNQLNPENPEQLFLYDNENVRLKSSAGITAGMQGKLQFHDGSWIIEFMRKIAV